MADSEWERGERGETTILGDHPRRTRTDIALVRRAIREGWNVPAHRKKELIEAMCDDAISAENPKLRSVAARVVLEADKQDQAFQLAKEAPEVAAAQVNFVQVNQAISAEAFRALPVEERLRLLRTGSAPDPAQIAQDSAGAAQPAAQATPPIEGAPSDPAQS